MRENERKQKFSSVFRIRIRIQIRRDRMFLGLTGPLVASTDPYADPAPDADPDPDKSVERTEIKVAK
jgi:hypothetical protein